MSKTGEDQSGALHRIDGRLHTVQKLKDETGRVVGTIIQPLKVELHLEDLGQLVAGACVIALPVTFTEEVWTLGASLSWGRTLAILAVSLVTLSLFVWALFYGKKAGEYKGSFVGRVALAYLLSFSISLLLLALVDKAPLDDIALSVKRAIIVAFPACFAATAVDYVK